MKVVGTVDGAALTAALEHVGGIAALVAEVKILWAGAKVTMEDAGISAIGGGVAQSLATVDLLFRARVDVIEEYGLKFEAAMIEPFRAGGGRRKTKKVRHRI